jgi:Kdo2-lipid IVA lauroyltransferase/acyltransferase
MGLLKRIKKSPPVTRLRRYLAYLVALAYFRLAPRISRRRAIRWGRALGRFAFRRVGYARKLTLDNLTRVFGGEMGEGEIEAVAERVYENLGVTALEFPRLPYIADREFFRNVDFRNEDIDYLRKLMAEGKGAIFASAHMGNWEMLADFGARLGLKMSVLYKPSTNPYFNRLWTELRGRNRLIDITASLSPVTARLKAGEAISLLFDENARSRGIEIPFFGRPASTYKGPAFFGLRTGAPILCLYFIRQPDGRHRFIIERTIRPRRSGDLEADLGGIMAEMNRSLEKIIRLYPDQWNWVYKRWN